MSNVCCPFRVTGGEEVFSRVKSASTLRLSPPGEVCITIRCSGMERFFTPAEASNTCTSTGPDPGIATLVYVTCWCSTQSRYGCRPRGTVNENSPLALLFVLATSCIPAAIFFRTIESPAEGLFVVPFRTAPRIVSAGAANVQAEMTRRISTKRFNRVDSFNRLQLPVFQFRREYEQLRPQSIHAWRRSPAA